MTGHTPGFARLRTQMLLLAAVLAGVSLLVSASIGLLRSSPLQGWSVLTMALSGTLLLLFALALVRQPNLWSRMERIGYSLMLLVFFVQFGGHFSRFGSGEPIVLTELFEVFVWVPVVFAITFLVYQGRQALVRSFVVLLGIIGMSGTYLYLDARYGTNLVPALMLIDLLLVSIVMIALLYVFTLTSRELALLQVHAELQVKLANTDPLTGLHNRRYLDQALSNEYQRARRYNVPLSVAMCDIDFFKCINDTLSHAVGDATLQAVAQILRGNTREVDTVARYGGEEFVILFPDTTLSQARSACKKIRREVEIYDWSAIHPDLRVTVSIGLSDDLSYAKHERILEHADTHLYEAKHQGKNQVCA